jgi:YegS/Rv2252/BmrU family lipid kinase
MSDRRIKIIVNPNADLGRAWQAAADLRPVVESLGGSDWTGTVYPNHAAELAYQAAQDGYDTVISAGGDGTAHEIINGLMRAPAERRPRMAIIPLGSGNDFAYAVGAPDDPVQAVHRALTGTPHRIDVGVLRGSDGRQAYWGNTIGIGFDATVTIRSRRFTRVRGFLIYLLAVLQTIALNHDAPILQVSSDAENWEQAMLMVVLCNGSREGGGFQVAPQARPDDGVLHYAAVEKVSRLMMLRLLPEVMNGTHASFSQVRMGTFHKISIRADRALTVHVDGEIFAGFGMQLDGIDAEILPGALEVVT